MKIVYFLDNFLKRYTTLTYPRTHTHTVIQKHRQALSFGNICIYIYCRDLHNIRPCAIMKILTWDVSQGSNYSHCRNPKETMLLFNDDFIHVSDEGS